MRDHRPEDHRLIWFDPWMIWQIVSSFCVVCSSVGGAFILSCTLLFLLFKSILTAIRFHTHSWSWLQKRWLYGLSCPSNGGLHDRDDLLGAPAGQLPGYPPTVHRRGKLNMVGYICRLFFLCLSYRALDL